MAEAGRRRRRKGAPFGNLLESNLGRVRARIRDAADRIQVEVVRIALVHRLRAGVAERVRRRGRRVHGRKAGRVREEGRRVRGDRHRETDEGDERVRRSRQIATAERVLQLDAVERIGPSRCSWCRTTAPVVGQRLADRAGAVDARRVARLRKGRAQERRIGGVVLARSRATSGRPPLGEDVAAVRRCNRVVRARRAIETAVRQAPPRAGSAGQPPAPGVPTGVPGGVISDAESVMPVIVSEQLNVAPGRRRTSCRRGSGWRRRSRCRRDR